MITTAPPSHRVGVRYVGCVGCAVAEPIHRTGVFAHSARACEETSKEVENKFTEKMKQNNVSNCVLVVSCVNLTLAVLLGCIECMWCRPFLLIFAVSVCQSVCHAEFSVCCINTISSRSLCLVCALYRLSLLVVSCVDRPVQLQFAPATCLDANEQMIKRKYNQNKHNRSWITTVLWSN